MTKEQKYPLAEPATYAPPQMEVIPLRGNGMLCGSGLNGKPYPDEINPTIMDFETSSSTEYDATRNGQFNEWDGSFF